MLEGEFPLRVRSGSAWLHCVFAKLKRTGSRLRSQREGPGDLSTDRVKAPRSQLTGLFSHHCGKRDIPHLQGDLQVLGSVPGFEPEEECVE